MYIFQTPACPRCGKAGLLEVEESAFDAWIDGALIQVAFANKSAAERKQLQTGFHPECWKLESGEADGTEG